MQFICLIAFITFGMASALFAGAQTTDSLTFKNFLNVVSKQHPTALGARLEQDVAAAEMQSAEGGFDPFITGGVTRKEQTSKEKFTSLQAGVELPLATMFGPKLEARYERGVGAFINPEVATEMSGQAVVGVSLPLWSGVITDKRRTALEKSRLAPQKAEAKITKEINKLLLEAGKVYWKWTESYFQLGVINNLLSIAEIRAKQIEAQVKAGQLPRIAMVEAQQEVQRRKGSLLSAQQQFEQTSNDVALFLWEQGLVPRTLREIPQDLPTLPVISEQEQEQNLQAAFALRPEILELEVARQVAQLELALTQEGEKPQIASKMQLMYAPDKPNIADYKVGVDMSFPLFFRTASAATEVNKIQIERIALRRIEVEREIRLDVENALIAYRRAIERLEVARLETQFAVELEEGERKQFAEGQSSLLVVNLRERSTGEARAKLVKAHAECLGALLQYYWATGRINELAN